MNLKKINKPICVYLFHIRGEARELWLDGKEELFEPKSNICIISHQKDGSHLVYSRTKNIQLKKYFKNHEIIFKKKWNPETFNRFLDLIMKTIDNPNQHFLRVFADITGRITEIRIVKDSRETRN